MSTHIYERNSRRESGETINVREISANEFTSLQYEWDRCASRSENWTLFSSWSWMYSWWETWGELLNLNLKLIGVFDDRRELVGIGPFFTHDHRMPLGQKIERLHFIGNAWHIASTVRSEYSGLIVSKKGGYGYPMQGC